MRRWGPVAWLALLVVLANLGLAVPAARFGSAFLVLWILPGLAWAVLLSGGSWPDIEEVAVGLGLGLATVSLTTLLVHYVPGPVTEAVLLLAIDGVVCTLLLAGVRHGVKQGRSLAKSPTLIGPLIAVLLVAALLRIASLGYSEFQGDEGLVMWRAGRAMLGDDSQLFYHQKGPGEVLVPLATWTLSGTISEWQARLPFSLAGLVGVLAVFLCGWRWYGSPTALAAGLLLAINGYFVGFGRIAQYQSLVLAMTALGLLALWRWSEGSGRRWLGGGALLLGFGLVAHYDAALALPAAAYIVWRRLRASASRRAMVNELMLSAGLGLAVAALFYLPFALHPNFASTLEYLGAARVGTGGVLHNNLLSQLPLATFYNSTYYLIAIAGLLLVAALAAFRRWWLLLPGLCLLMVAVVLTVDALSLVAGPALLLLVGGAVLSRWTSPGARVAWLWFGVPFLVYYFLVWDPRTHVLNAFPGAVLLAAAALAYLVGLLSPAVRRVAGCLLVAVFVLLACHPLVMFVRHDPEIKRSWPQAQPSLYWRPSDDVPLFGYFGFPYRAGWKAVGMLFEDGMLTGVYGSNEEQYVTYWYMRGAQRSYCPDPDWYLIAEDVQDEVAIDWDEVESGYTLWGWVEVGGRAKLSIYRRGHEDRQTLPILLHEYERRFDAGATAANLMPHPLQGQAEMSYTLGGVVRLHGYSIERLDPSPGGSIEVVLYWEALEPVDGNYQVFTHLYDGVMRGQHDGTPGCGLWPTLLWEPGQVVRDEHTIKIAADTPPGDVPLLVGMYDLGTGTRLSVSDLDGRPVGDAVQLGLVAVE